MEFFVLYILIPGILGFLFGILGAITDTPMWMTLVFTLGICFMWAHYFAPMFVG